MAGICGTRRPPERYNLELGRGVGTRAASVPRSALRRPIRSTRIPTRLRRCTRIHDDSHSWLCSSALAWRRRSAAARRSRSKRTTCRRKRRRRSVRRRCAATDPTATDRMLAAVLPDGDRAWFFKVTGPVARSRLRGPTRSTSFLPSVRPAAGQAASRLEAPRRLAGAARLAACAPRRS